MTAQREHSGGFAWLHDDSEEDLVGSDWHQQAINALYAGLNELLRSRDLPWHVGNQMALAAPPPAARRERPLCLGTRHLLAARRRPLARLRPRWPSRAIRVRVRMT